MSNLLWKYYLEDDVERFRRLLAANTSYNPQYALKTYGGVGGIPHSIGSIGGSPGGFATSPKAAMKQRRVSGQVGNAGGSRGGNTALSRGELNSRDYAGLTVLHRAASSTSENAITFAMALIDHPAIDLYVQDTESGWTALHRALYFGNVTIARAIMDRDAQDPKGAGSNTGLRVDSSVIKVKDHEGNSPFDVYNATIARRTLQDRKTSDTSEDDSDDDPESTPSGQRAEGSPFQISIDGDELFVFGSNKNFSLGFGDEDDRQHPEKIVLKRPDHLLFRFHQEHLESMDDTIEASHIFKSNPKSVNDLPALIQNRPIVIQDVALSKLHSAVLTTDPESNLYMCGFGPGGRLGTGDEITRFVYVCIEEGGLAGKKVMAVALGQNHSLAVSSEGEIFSWGTNSVGQLGYTLPRPALKDQEPVCISPRQIFGPLKREVIIGVAASAIHSVAHTSTSLFCWGKNEGQLGLMDSDSRSLEVQWVPRKVAASLFKSPITMVSAINGATTCLLANHTVCVFTNYGYNIVKFPLQEGFSNLQSNTLTTRYDSMSNYISFVTAGGDTIAAVSSRGDLFTLNVRKIDTNATAASTTNPSKIKGALSQPQRVWSLRKGNWDRIKSVGVAENGSVIVCTQAGAVWRRVKRAKIKDAYTVTGDFSPKDYKFQRVPGLTKVAAVRSTTFGVYAAIRKDCDVTKTQILIDDQGLWQDFAPLLSIQDLNASEPLQEEDIETPRFWKPALPKDLFDPLKRAILTSPDLEGDVTRHLLGKQLEEYDVEICTTTSSTLIPVHGFILAARSSVLRDALSTFRSLGVSSMPDVFSMEKSPRGTKIVFHGLDFITLVNLVVYLYNDAIVDVWHFSRQTPKMGFRYRQVRIEVMKLAAHLKMGRLEAAARLMTEPQRCLNMDFTVAIQDPKFFADGDVTIELLGSEVVAHSTVLCQRCPFFEGLFNGRARGEWLAGRRQHESDAVRVDLKHIEPETFQIVLRYIYTDIGSELFDHVICDDIDEFSDLVMDVMSVANELMLDRLSQICQHVIGRFVNTRNICHLLNAVAPCSVTDFKHSALEYLCLQLESMLENHLIDDLDEDLLLELDDVVRANQLNCLPFAKSGRATQLLHERHPTLAGDIDEERQRRLRDMAFRATLKEDDGRLSSSFRTRFGSLDDLMSGSPSQDKARKKSKPTRNAPFSPSIRPKDSVVDLMFDMDEDVPLAASSPEVQKPALELPSTPARDTASPMVRLEHLEPRATPEDENSFALSKPTGLGIGSSDENPMSSAKMWSSPALPSSKLNMREIMAQASSSRTSNLSMSLSAQNLKEDAVTKVSTPKLSQKERKKQHQQALQQVVAHPQISLEKGDKKPSSPWQVPLTGVKTSLKDVLTESKSSPLAVPTNPTVPAIPTQPLMSRRTASPDTRFSGQQRSAHQSPTTKTQNSPSSRPSRPLSQLELTKSTPTFPHSKSYTAKVAMAEPSLQLSMADIIGQQKREQEVVKEAAAKRSLQEIQEEQAFQEWWDLESRRTQEEEASRAQGSANGQGRLTKSGGRGGRAKGGSRDKGGRERGGVSKGKPSVRGRGDSVQGRASGRGRGQERSAS